MKTVKDFRDDFCSTQEKIETILELAESENRAFTPAEKTRLEALEKRLGEIEKDLELQEKIEARIAQKIGDRVAARGGAKELGAPGNPRDFSYRAGVAKALLECARTGNPTTAKINPAAVFKTRETRDLMLSDSGSAGKSLYKATFAGFDLQAIASTRFISEYTIIPTRNSVSFPYVARTDRITAENKAESDSLTEQAYVISSNTTAFKNYYGLVEVHRNVLRDASNDDLISLVGSLSEKDIAIGFGGDSLTGDGASNNMRGIKEYAGVLTQDHASDRLNGYSPFVEAYKTLMGKNVNDNISVIMSPTSWKQLAELTDSTGQPLLMPMQLNGVRWYTSTLIPENLGAGNDETFIIMGDLSKVQLYVDEEISMSVDTEVSGHVGFKKDSVHIRQTWRGDIQLYEPDHIIVIENISTSALVL